MQRFKAMEKYQVNNIYKIKDIDVNYYSVFGQTVQFDEIFELTVDLDMSERGAEKRKLIYADGRVPIIMTIEEIYNGLQEDKWQNPQLPEVKGYNSYIDKNSIKKTTGKFKPKALIFLADELNELMNTDDYQARDTIQNALGSVARLGRAFAPITN